MSTITETFAGFWPRLNWEPFAAALAAWMLLLIAVTVVFEPVKDVAILGPPARTLPLLDGSGLRIVSVADTYLVIRGDKPGFVRALYARGALLVLPMPTGGCLGKRGSPL